MRAFRREGDHLVAEVDPGEREVLATVVADVAELLGGGRFEDRARETGSARPQPDASGGPDDPAALAMRLRLDPLPAPDDPAVHRLLPDASRDDADVAAEFRRLTEDDLRQQKIDRLAVLFDALTVEALGHGAPGEEPPDAAAADDEPPRRRRRDRGRHEAVAVVRVAKDRAPALAATLTDVRLVLGERLGVTDEEASERLERDVVHGRPADAEGQARQYLGSVFLALGWWQETLMACLLADLPGALGARD
ncbi:DUF2017 family protein [Cellulomonas pakistanensis]|uniref:DUF2017 domain-containing protein n=1 Tax=Cellulomonas pakistanensis TaxID=992287 RepID=A0A919P9R7_9CELL|nr:DUF2017 family protein [Cellulomonas pakistanensis]GIG35718.1 hypothetical protein Cpa01nite_10990 [Cellulomonas pakistanensis]